MFVNLKTAHPPGSATQARLDIILVWRYSNLESECKGDSQGSSQSYYSRFVSKGNRKSLLRWGCLHSTTYFKDASGRVPRTYIYKFTLIFLHAASFLDACVSEAWPTS